MNYVIRKAAEADKEAVLALGRKTVDEYERTHLGDEVADGYINSGACDGDFIKIYDNITVMLENDVIIGLIACEKNEIQGFLMDSLYWGKGTAQTLLDHAENELFRGYEEITLECFESSPRANAFYRKTGFIANNIVDGDGGRRVVYTKSLAP